MKLTTILIGGLILIASIGAMLLVGRFLNPPAQQVFVAVREIQPGETLSPDMVRLANVHLPSTAAFVTAGDIDHYGYAKVVEPIHEGMFISKAALSFAENPAASNRVSLALADPNLVAMTIPVTPLTCPNDLVPGDRVSLDVSVGSANLMSGSFSASKSSPAENSSSGTTSSNPPGLAGTSSSPFVTPVPTPTPEPQFSLPVTKNLVPSGRVLSVVYNETLNPAGLQSPNSSTAPQTVRGDIKAIVVAVPRSLQEALAFAIANGEVRVAVLDPNAKDDSSSLTAGMSWDDLVAYFQWQRQEWLATPRPTGPIEPPGAASLLQDQPQPTNPAPTATISAPVLTPPITPQATPIGAPTSKP